MTIHLLVILILVGGWLFGRLASSLWLPRILGMMLWGLLLGTLYHDDIPQAIWAVVPLIKSTALAVLLIRAGLSLDLSTFHRIDPPAVRLAVIPAVLESLILVLLFRYLVGFEWVIAALAAILITAVSPAVAIPVMLTLKENRYGENNDMPNSILTGASLEVVLVLYTMVLGLIQGGEISLLHTALMLSWTLIMGVLSGGLAGLFLIWLFERFDTRIQINEKTILIFGLCLFLTQVSDWLKVSPLLGIIAMSSVLATRMPKVSELLSAKYKGLWDFNEAVLFVLIGISIKLESVTGILPWGILMIALGLTARAAGMILATQFASMPWNERIFSVFVCIPKATCTGRTRSLAYATGNSGGETIFAYAVLSILIATPLEMLGIRITGKRLFGVSPGQ